jgi:hypothetical protein
MHTIAVNSGEKALSNRFTTRPAIVTKLDYVVSELGDIVLDKAPRVWFPDLSPVKWIPQVCPYKAVGTCNRVIRAVKAFGCASHSRYPACTRQLRVIVSLAVEKVFRKIIKVFREIIEELAVLSVCQS